MAETNYKTRKATLDKDLDKLIHVEAATTVLAQRLVAPGLALLFLALVAIFSAIFTGGEPRALIIIAAAAIGGYMALNIGANDVANNVGPAVGAKALTIGGALIIAAVFESAGALLAGGDVVDTIAKGIIDPSAVSDPAVFIRLMLAALVSSALWVNVATWIGAPVSTTHAVVGGVVGAGIAAVGPLAVDWNEMSRIAASWVISPLLGGVIAALFLAFVKDRIVYRSDKIAAACKWVPLLIAIMAGAFCAYLATKGLNHLIDIDARHLAMIGIAAFLVTWWLANGHVRRMSAGLENRNQSLRKLFKLPLIISAALLSFAHGANDVANAVGPLAAIVHTATANDITAEVDIPFWVMVIGAIGISAGLMLFGSRLIRMVGEQITKLNPIRAFCVALSAAITVIVASWFGLPVSSTHIAVGAVFGVGFYREWYTTHSKRRRLYIEHKKEMRLAERGTAEPDLLETIEDTLVETSELPEQTSSEEARRRKLVRRAHVSTIVAAWVTTVPASALLAAAVFLALDAVG